jgi:hypothetical protein
MGVDGTTSAITRSADKWALLGSYRSIGSESLFVAFFTEAQIRLKLTPGRSDKNPNDPGKPGLVVRLAGRWLGSAQRCMTSG